MSITKRFILQLGAIALPILIFIGSSLYWQLESGLSSMTTDLHSRTLANVVNELESDLRDQIQSINDVALAQPPLQTQLLSQQRLLGRTLLVMNHHGELRLLLPEDSRPNGIEQSILERFQSIFTVGSFQFERSGVMPVAHQFYSVSVIPVQNKLWRGMALVQELTPAKLKTLGNASELIGSISVTPESQLGSTISIPIATFSGEPLRLSATFHHWQAMQKNQLLISLMAMFVLAIVLMLAVMVFHLWRQLIAPAQELSTLLKQHQANKDWHKPVVMKGSGATKGLSALINSLSLEIANSHLFYHTALNAVSDAAIMVDRHGRVTQLSPVAELLLGLKTDQVWQKQLADIMPGNSGAQLDAMLVALLNGSQVHEEGRVQLAKAQLAKMVDFSITRVDDRSGSCLGAVVTLKDITRSELLKRELKRKAQYDVITGLFNRQSFDQHLAQLESDDGQHAICYMDLARFKLINDSCGHEAGDRMLKDVSDAMQRCLRKSDFLARIGGDEFALILTNTTALEAARQLKILMDKVRGITLYWDSGSYTVGLHIGVAFHRGEESNPREVFKDAELACQAAKSKGDSQIHFFDSLDQDLAHQRNAPAWAMKINEAILNDNLVLFFQPIEAISHKTPKRRMEILLRIREENGSILAPAQFIAAAERFNLMPTVDRAVVRKAFEWLARHPELWDTQVMSVNLSGTSLSSDGLVDYIDELVKSLNIPTHCICFEVTETAAISNESRALDILHALRRRGFAFALDDFGSGFASYGYLRQLPVDYVKIDGCFVRNLATNAKDYAIVKSIHDVCRVIGIETVAEFVEDQDTLDQLNAIGVNYAQGYGIGRPKDLETYQPDLPSPEEAMQA
ncbi:PAS domain S-box-containing protein/diguanylate cyclase (GGDEF) domain-containing protein [Ferrimonas sediminum]|uniref:PAS domain S-box-containing protein/diguanylate cyclase (GGDEF) domain-containing protein n=1 Tax=Ferrimonas sediminum TaxID=718193 RepID=A0A1G8KJ25_9GAMM|nr:EAL domain-containing protein [Ferrimonas sediminum]SDI43443.1 PAS domain S-box-containing protein/diguanylate cyclase (GGDEF) domain-containing protein [Ferrimonas sediminum]